MPLTPIHASIAYLAGALRPTLSLPALLVSTMSPDLEIPLIYVVTGGEHSRLVMHSLLGAVTLAPILSVALTVFAYAPVVSRVFKLNFETVNERCRFSFSLVIICLAGSLSHVFIDSLHHEYNPLLFPFTLDSFDALVLMKDWTFASVVVSLAFLTLLIFFVANEARRGTDNIWDRLLVG